MKLPIRAAVIARVIVASVFAAFFPAVVLADQQSFTLSITPPLINVSLQPGDSWSNSIKVVNNNDYDITVAAQAEDFMPDGEGGSSVFRPITSASDTDPYSLAAWVGLPQKTFFIPRGAAMDIPYTLHIPTDASPGGHYAGILVGSVPPNGTGQMNVSSMVSSLILLRVGGDVREAGYIKEFYADHGFVTSPSTSFTLRFANTGNTHLQPQGDIAIYNMWGKVRGKIFVNQDSHFGSVLPKSTRKFQFRWTGESSLLEAGLYSAQATLTYGTDLHQNESATTYFWVIPVVPIVSILGTMLAVTLIFIVFVKRSIRRALARQTALLEREFGIDPEKFAREEKAARSAPPRHRQGSRSERMLPRALRIAVRHAPMFLRRYPGQIAWGAGVLVLVVVIGMYVATVMTPERQFTITVTKEGHAAYPFSSEEVREKELASGAPAGPAAPGGQVVAGASFDAQSTLVTPEERKVLSLGILNIGDASELAAHFGVRLEHAGYILRFLDHDRSGAWKEEGIYYRPGYLRAAAAIQDIVGTRYALTEQDALSFSSTTADVIIVIQKPN